MLRVRTRVISVLYKKRDCTFRYRTYELDVGDSEVSVTLNLLACGALTVNLQIT